MNKENQTLPPEDYIEPRCLLSGDPYGLTPEVKPVPQQRIMQKMDDYMSRRDFEGAKRHLHYWYKEAELGHDLKGKLMVCNELVGYYRKQAQKENAFQYGQEALALLEKLGMEESISAGTTYVNLATACNAFGENEQAIELFKKAKRIYESASDVRPDLLGGLYNNMALTCTALGDYKKASDYYHTALEIMAGEKNGELEQAITYLNMAGMVEAELGLEEGESRIDEYLDLASQLLDTPTLPQDGYSAFVYEKCAPAFDYYGYFLKGQELKDRAGRIYTEYLINQ